MIVGIDEVGRGAWAGPLLVVAAAGLPPKQVADSKLLRRSQREGMMKILQESCTFGEGWVGPDEIDAVGLTEAMKLGVARALDALQASDHDKIIMDGHINYCPPSFRNVSTIIKADMTHPIVSAASVYAKVRRDTFMATLDDEHSNYGFGSHVGYGTAAHRTALQVLGVSRHHRRSYKPIKAFL